MISGMIAVLCYSVSTCIHTLTMMVMIEDGLTGIVCRIDDRL